MRTIVFCSAVAAAFAAGPGCAGEIDDMPGDPEDACDDPAYRDGTCDVDLSCQAPDIDCYILFDDQAEASAWFAGIEEQIAAVQLREPRRLLPPTDQHHIRMRGLLDEGWRAYREVNPVGDLAPIAPELVIVEDPTINAFVQGDGEKAGYAVMVHTGIMAVASDDELVSIVMHELTHAIRLHVLPGVGDTVRIHYRADGGEPFGFEQADDPMAREFISDWRTLAADVGPLNAAPLVGFPMPVGNGTLYRIFTLVAKTWSESHPEACATPLAAVSELTSDVMTYYSRLDQTLHLDGVEESLATAQNNVLLAVRDQCMAELTDSYLTILADLNGKTEEEMREMLPDEDEALIEGKTFIAGLATLVDDRRRKMRELEAEFATASGVAWDRVRHYTTEEEADDSTIPVLTAMGRDPAGIGPGLLLLDDEATRTACTELLGAEVPPYGADLQDDHHANCWRVWHVDELAASGRLTDGASALRRQPQAAPTRAPRYRPLPYPTSVADYTVY